MNFDGVARPLPLRLVAWDRGPRSVAEGDAVIAMVDGSTSPDGAVVISFPGACDGVYAIGLRRVLVQVIRHRRPVCLILDLAEVRELDPIILGTLAAACCLGDDHGVGVFLDNSPAGFADLLAAAGVPRRRLRHVR